MTKNVVIVCDHTAILTGRRTDTNVSRLYQALDLSDSARQVAFYDIGVGMERWTPLTLFTGGFGLAVTRSVLEMHKFLSRNYQTGDRVFIFGCGRGAYIVRILVGFVNYAGLMKDSRNLEDLHTNAQLRYRAFRKRCFRRAPIRWTDWIARQVGGRRQRHLTPTDDTTIAFLGVWDTVDAFGLPIDEVATAWDTYVYPYRFTDRVLSPIVRRAAHAIALDDGRHTFHPVLWDESPEVDFQTDNENTKRAERIRQVWFAGTHDNLSGGNPDDSLAHVSLDWMLSETEDEEGISPLVFLPGAREALAKRGDVHGKLYDSRSGLQVYYPYKLRNVAELCNDPMAGVAATVRIHESVFARIGQSAFHYAPLGVPADYKIVPIRRGTTPPIFETPEGSVRRAAAMEEAWDAIQWQRWLYYTLILTTLVLVASPVILPWTEYGMCTGGKLLCMPDNLIKAASPYMPDWSTPWQNALGQNPLVFYLILLIYLAQRPLTQRLRQRVGTIAAAAWRLSFRGREHIRSISHNSMFAKFFPITTRRLRTLCTGRCAALRIATIDFVTISLAGIAIVALFNKALYMFVAVLGSTCSASEHTLRLHGIQEPQTVVLDVGDPCLATGITLVGGERYSITVQALPAPGVTPEFAADPYVWRDGVIPAGPSGYAPWAVEEHLTAFQQVGSRLTALLLSRAWSEDMFVLLGQLGESSVHPFVIGDGIGQFTAPYSGELFVFVNDGVLGLPFLWDLPYHSRLSENRGVARLTIAPYRAP